MENININKDLSIVKSAVENYEDNWTSKKELADMCRVDVRTITNIIEKLIKETDFTIQSHIKKGGYHNLETYYDDYLVKLIQAKLLSNQATLFG